MEKQKIDLGRHYFISQEETAKARAEASAAGKDPDEAERNLKEQFSRANAIASAEASDKAIKETEKGVREG